MPATRSPPSVPITVEPGSTLIPEAARRLGQRAIRRGAQIRDGGDDDAGRVQIQRRLIGGIAAGDDDGARADAHAIAVEDKSAQHRSA